MTASATMNPIATPNTLSGSIARCQRLGAKRSTHSERIAAESMRNMCADFAVKNGVTGKKATPNVVTAAAAWLSQSQN